MAYSSISSSVCAHNVHRHTFYFILILCKLVHFENFSGEFFFFVVHMCWYFRECCTLYTICILTPFFQSWCNTLRVTLCRVIFVVSKMIMKSFWVTRAETEAKWHPSYYIEEPKNVTRNIWNCSTSRSLGFSCRQHHFKFKNAEGWKRLLHVLFGRDALRTPEKVSDSQMTIFAFQFSKTTAGDPFCYYTLSKMTISMGAAERKVHFGCFGNVSLSLLTECPDLGQPAVIPIKYNKNSSRRFKAMLCVFQSWCWIIRYMPWCIVLLSIFVMEK